MRGTSSMEMLRQIFRPFKGVMLLSRKSTRSLNNRPVKKKSGELDKNMFGLDFTHLLHHERLIVITSHLSWIRATARDSLVFWWTSVSTLSSSTPFLLLILNRPSMMCNFCFVSDRLLYCSTIFNPSVLHVGK